MTLQVGERIKYVVETNPHADEYGASPGTYEGAVLERNEHCGYVERDGKKYNGIIFTIQCDDGQIIETSMFADLERPLS